MNSSDISLVLAQFAPILWDGLQHPERSDGKGSSVANFTDYDQKFGSEILLEPDEVAKWNELYHLNKHIKAMKSELVFPKGVGTKGAKVTVCMENNTLQPVLKLRNLDGLTYYMETHAYIGFNGVRPYNAFIGQRIYVKDSEQRWIFAQVKGGSAGTYHRIFVADASLGFNLSVDPDKLNSVEVALNNPNTLLLQAQLHRMPTAEDSYQIEEPLEAARTDFFFWQVLQFMEPASSARNRKPLM